MADVKGIFEKRVPVTLASNLVTDPYVCNNLSRDLLRTGDYRNGVCSFDSSESRVLEDSQSLCSD